jgi:hypothetical protein
MHDKRVQFAVAKASLISLREPIFMRDVVNADGSSNHGGLAKSQSGSQRFQP